MAERARDQVRQSQRIRPECKSDRAMRAVGSLPRRRSARKWQLQGRPRSGSPSPISSFPTRSGRLKDEVRLEAGLFCASHHGTQKDGFEFTAVIGEVAVRLAKDRNDLRHLQPELAVLVGERGPMTLRLVLLPFGRVRPNLNALPGKRSPVACAAYGATHPETTLADPIHNRRALAVIVGPARHRLGRREALRAGGQQESGNPGCQDSAASGEKVAAVEYDGGHVNSSCDRAVAPPRGTRRETP